GGGVAGQGQEESRSPRRHQTPHRRSGDVAGDQERAMTGALALVAVLAGVTVPVPRAPLSIVIQSVRGEARIPVQLDALSSPVLPAPALLSALGASAARVEGWAEVAVGGRSFR